MLRGHRRLRCSACGRSWRSRSPVRSVRSLDGASALGSGTASRRSRGERCSSTSRGSFILGVLFAVLVERNIGSLTLRLALMTGLLGAYTTFSTFSLETFRLVEDGATGSALANIGLSVVLGVLAVWLGLTAGRAVA